LLGKAYTYLRMRLQDYMVLFYVTIIFIIPCIIVCLAKLSDFVSECRAGKKTPAVLAGTTKEKLT